MHKSDIRGSFRWLVRDGLSSWVILAGLSLGMSACLIIWSYVTYENSYDRYHENHRNIFRIETETVANGLSNRTATCPLRYAPALVTDFPEVMDAARIVKTVKRSFSFEDKYFMEDGVYYADQSFLDMFSFRMLEGDPVAALNLPFTMVLTESVSRKYFGDESPLGKVITWDQSNNYIVTGLIEDPPSNSHFRFTVLASFSTFFDYNPNLEYLWLEWNVPTYILLEPGMDAGDFEEKFSGFSEKYLKTDLETRGISIRHELRALEQLHLAPSLPGSLGTPRDAGSIRSILLVMVLIILIAGFNFIVLNTARTGIRSQEILIRKACGADRSSVIKRFMAEPLLLSLFSLFMAFFISLAAEPHFSKLSGVPIQIIEFGTFGFGTAVVLITGLVAGFIASVQILNPSGSGRKYLVSVPVVIQLGTSIVLLAFALMVNGQYKYLRDKDPGFEKERLVILLQNQEVRESLDAFMDEILEIEGVVSATASSMVPGEMYLFSSGTYPEGHPEDPLFRMDNFRVDHRFLDSYGIETVAGRSFFPEEKSGDVIMINQTALEELGWKEPILKWIEIPSVIPSGENSRLRYSVIGVFRDFHHRDLYSSIQPTFIRLVSNQGPIENRARRLSVEYTGTAGMDSLVSLLGQKWRQFFGDTPFYTFNLRENYDSIHQKERQLGRIYTLFTFLAIGITLLGLFALAYFITGRRIREVAIRKVYGAGIMSLLILLNRQYFWLVCLANLSAWPVAWFQIRSWLQNYPYTAGTDPLVALALIPGSFILFLAVVSIRSYRAANLNPAHTLRYE